MGAILFITIVSLKLFDGAYRFLWEAKTDGEKTQIISSVMNLTFINALVASSYKFNSIQDCWFPASL